MFYPLPSQDFGVETTAPFKRRVGHEVEVAGNMDFARYLWDHGYAVPQTTLYAGLHQYHCQCPEANDYGIHPTSDGTASGGEHIIGGTGGVLFGSPAYTKAIRYVAEAAEATGAEGSPSTGGHIHVSSDGLDKEKALDLFRTLTLLWAQITEIASGPWDEVRSNENMRAPQPGVPLLGVYGTTDSYSGWPVDGGLMACDDALVRSFRSNSNAFRFFWRQGEPMRKTVEFRVWNTTTSRWRLYMGAGVSAALVEATVQGRGIDPSLILSPHDIPDLLDYLDGLLTPDLVTLVERQRAILRGDFSMAA